MAGVGCRRQEVGHSRRRKRNPGARKGRLQDPTIRAKSNRGGRCFCRCDDGGQLRAFQRGLRCGSRGRAVIAPIANRTTTGRRPYPCLVAAERGR